MDTFRNRTSVFDMFVAVVFDNIPFMYIVQVKTTDENQQRQ